MRAIIYLYCQEGYINISANKAVREDDLLLLYQDEELVGMFNVPDVKGFYLSRKELK